MAQIRAPCAAIRRVLQQCSVCVTNAMASRTARTMGSRGEARARVARDARRASGAIALRRRMRPIAVGDVRADTNVRGRHGYGARRGRAGAVRSVAARARTMKDEGQTIPSSFVLGPWTSSAHSHGRRMRLGQRCHGAPRARARAVPATRLASWLLSWRLMPLSSAGVREPMSSSSGRDAAQRRVAAVSVGRERRERMDAFGDPDCRRRARCPSRNCRPPSPGRSPAAGRAARLRWRRRSKRYARNSIDVCTRCARLPDGCCHRAAAEPAATAAVSPLGRPPALPPSEVVRLLRC